MRRALMKPQPVTLHQDAAEITARVVVRGTASGILMGSLNLIGRAIGWACPNFADAILFLEAVDTEIGQIERSLDAASESRMPRWPEGGRSRAVHSLSRAQAG